MVIKDKVIEPYVIEVDDYNYSVYIPGFTKKGKLIRKSLAYFNDLRYAILHIAKQRVISSDRVVSLREFVTEYEKFVSELKEAVSTYIVTDK